MGDEPNKAKSLARHDNRIMPSKGPADMWMSTDLTPQKICTIMNSNFIIVRNKSKYRHNRGLDPHLYYYRDNHKNEIDVIIKHSAQLIPVEIKSGQTFHKDFLKGLKYYQEIAGDRVKTGYVVYAGELSQSVSGFQLINYRDTTRIYSDIEKGSY